MLLIKAKGGLGNRILSTASAIVYANATERKWCIDWCDGIYAIKGNNAYEALFSSDANTRIPKSQEYDATIPEIWHGRLHESPSRMVRAYSKKKHANPLVYREFSAPLSKRCDDKNLEIFWSHTSKFGRIKRFMKTKRSRESALRDTLARYFQPCEQVMLMVDLLLARSKGKVIGVHIRYTDLKVPIEKVLLKIEQCMKGDEYHSLFLATDSAKVEKLVKKKFQHVIVSDKEFNPKNKQLHTLVHSDKKTKNATAALVDMVALSRCDALVYCSRSTFSETSRLMGSFNRRTIFDIDRYNVKVRIKRFIQEYL